MAWPAVHARKVAANAPTAQPEAEHRDRADDGSGLSFRRLAAIDAKDRGATTMPGWPAEGRVRGEMRRTVGTTLDIPRPYAPAAKILRGTGRQQASADDAAGDLRAAIRHYEQHVIAWYALGRIIEARSARGAIVHCREKAGSPTHSQ